MSPPARPVSPVTKIIKPPQLSLVPFYSNDRSTRANSEPVKNYSTSVLLKDINFQDLAWLNGNELIFGRSPSLKNQPAETYRDCREMFVHRVLTSFNPRKAH